MSDSRPAVAPSCPAACGLKPSPADPDGGLRRGVTLTEATNTVAVYSAAHLGTTATSFGNLLSDADGTASAAFTLASQPGAAFFKLRVGYANE